jgi:hypothetical protein
MGAIVAAEATATKAGVAGALEDVDSRSSQRGVPVFVSVPIPLWDQGLLCVHKAPIIPCDRVRTGAKVTLPSPSALAPRKVLTA